MNLLAQAGPPQLWLTAVVIAALWGFLGVCGWVLVRLRSGLPILPFQRRKPVPWQGVDLLIIAAVGIVLLTAFQGLAVWILGPDLTKPPDISSPEESSAAHSIILSIAEGDWRVFVLCAFSAVLVAPIVEEFVFRLLLQGWLEALQHRWRREMPVLRRVAPGGALPIFVTSFLFAMMHFRVASEPADPYYYIGMLLAASVAELLLMGFAIKWLPMRVEATATDLGWSKQHFLADVRLGLATFAGLAAPVYAMQVALAFVLPKYVAPDVFTLFFFAIALGVLYRRTHRITASIVLHMALNATSLAVALLALPQQA